MFDIALADKEEHSKLWTNNPAKTAKQHSDFPFQPDYSDTDS